MSALASAIEQAPAAIRSALRPGLGAMRSPHASKVRPANARHLTGSLDVDGALASDPVHGAAHRWDYGVGYGASTDTERVVWIEVHPASTSDVKTVLAKLAWLKRYLADEAPELAQLTRRAPRWVWLATDAGTHIRAGTSASRLLAQHGLRLPTRVVDLP